MPASHQGDPGSVLGHSTHNFGGQSCYWVIFLYEHFGFTRLIITLPFCTLVMTAVEVCDRTDQPARLYNLNLYFGLHL
jgi:hypothetical protein